MELEKIFVLEEDNKTVTTDWPGYVRKEVKTGNDPNGVQVKVIFPSEKGFTLIELMITLCILCFALLAMGTHIGVVMKTTIKDKQITAGSAMLQDKTESLKRVPFANISTGTDTVTAFGLGYTRNWTVTPVSNNMKQVQVDVSWRGAVVSGSTIISQ